MQKQNRKTGCLAFRIKYDLCNFWLVTFESLLKYVFFFDKEICVFLFFSPYGFFLNNSLMTDRASGISTEMRISSNWEGLLVSPLSRLCTTSGCGGWCWCWLAAFYRVKNSSNHRLVRPAKDNYKTTTVWESSRTSLWPALPWLSVVIMFGSDCIYLCKHADMADPLQWNMAVPVLHQRVMAELYTFRQPAWAMSSQAWLRCHEQHQFERCLRPMTP